MGVSVNQYLILGVKLRYEELDSEATEDYEDDGYKPNIIHKNGLAVISDGMDGKYRMVGRILQKGRVNDTLQGQFCFEPVDVERTELIAGLINLSFPNFTVGPQDIKTWFVTHYH